MLRLPPISTRTDTRLPYSRSSDLHFFLEFQLLLFPLRQQGRVGGRAPLFIRNFRVEVRMAGLQGGKVRYRSEEHTSELQSLMRISYAVFCLKKKNHESINRYSRNRTVYNMLKRQNTMHE